MASHHDDKRGRLIAVAVTFAIVGLGSYSAWSQQLAHFTGNLFGPSAESIAQDAKKSVEDRAYPKAIELAKESLKKDEANKEAHLVLARAYVETNEPQQALEQTDWLIKSDLLKQSDELQRVLLFQGIALMQLKDFEKAEEVLESAADTPPENAQVFSMYGEVLMRNNAFKEAIEQFGKSIKVNPNNADVYSRRAMACEQLHQDQAAADDWGAALDRDKQNKTYALNYALASERLKQYGFALHVLEETIDLNQNDAELLKAEKRVIMEAFYQAREDHLRRPQDPIPYADGALAMVRNKAWQDAIMATNKAVALGGTKVPMVYRLRADANFGLGKYHEALADYDRAMAIDPSITITKRHRDRVLKKLNRSS